MNTNIFNPLIGNNESILSINELSYNDDSYYINTVNFLIETNKEYSDCKKEYYKSILECKDYRVLNESFNTFLESAKKIIKKIIDFILDMFNRFIAWMADKLEINSFYKSKAKILKDKFISSDEFVYDGFRYRDDIYSTQKPEVKLTYCMTELTDKFVDVSNGSFLSKTSKARNVEELYRIVQSSSVELDDYINYEFYDKFRASILNENYYTTITEEFFKEECDSYFRCGDTISMPINIDKKEVLKCIKFIEDYKVIKNHIRQEKMTFDSMVKKAVKDIEINAKIVLDNRFYADSNITLDDNVRTEFNHYTQTILDALRGTLSIYSIYISSKLGALKECNTQSIDICKILLTRY